MDLQQWFYILGIIFIVSWFAILVGLVVVGVIAYRRYQQIKQDVKTRGALLFTTSALLKKVPMAKLVPLITAVPLATSVLKMFFGKNHKR